MALMPTPTATNERVPEPLLRELEQCLRCPITHCLFLEPVTASDNHVYERSSLQTWIDQGEGTSPFTRRAIRILGPNPLARAAVHLLLQQCPHLQTEVFARSRSEPIVECTTLPALENFVRATSWSSASASASASAPEAWTPEEVSTWLRHAWLEPRGITSVADDSDEDEDITVQRHAVLWSWRRGLRCPSAEPWAWGTRPWMALPASSPFHAELDNDIDPRPSADDDEDDDAPIEVSRTAHSALHVLDLVARWGHPDVMRRCRAQAASLGKAEAPGWTSALLTALFHRRRDMVEALVEGVPRATLRRLLLSPPPAPFGRRPAREHRWPEWDMSDDWSWVPDRVIDVVLHRYILDPCGRLPHWLPDVADLEDEDEDESEGGDDHENRTHGTGTPDRHSPPTAPTAPTAATTMDSATATAAVRRDEPRATGAAWLRSLLPALARPSTPRLWWQHADLNGCDNDVGLDALWYPSPRIMTTRDYEDLVRYLVEVADLTPDLPMLAGVLARAPLRVVKWMAARCPELPPTAQAWMWATVRDAVPTRPGRPLLHFLASNAYAPTIVQWLKTSVGVRTWHIVDRARRLTLVKLAVHLGRQDLAWCLLGHGAHREGLLLMNEALDADGDDDAQIVQWMPTTANVRTLGAPSTPGDSNDSDAENEDDHENDTTASASDNEDGGDTESSAPTTEESSSGEALRAVLSEPGPGTGTGTGTGRNNGRAGTGPNSQVSIVSLQIRVPRWPRRRARPRHQD